MGWKDFFRIPKVVAEQGQRILELEADVSGLKKDRTLLEEKTVTLEKAMTLLQGQMTFIEKFFTATPTENAIEEKETDEIDIDENFRIPVVDGMHMRFENEPAASAIPIRIYGPKQNGKKT